MSTQVPLSWAPQPTYHANGYTAPSSAPDASIPLAFMPHGSKSLSGIALRSALLGLSLGLSSALTAYLIFVQASPLWRIPCFLSILSLFHFLEFYITAAYNPTIASISAFLFSQNGSAYTIAHTMAFLECLVSYGLLGEYKEKLMGQRMTGVLVMLGLGMVTVGQGVRSLAMVHAGSNFNHTVQMRKKEGHELVTDGIYAWSRHPSYLGFFWWGLGTQLTMGNWLCLVGYAMVLWRFFHDRIQRKFEITKHDED